MFRDLLRAIADKAIGDDPAPEYSRLDRWDGRGTVPMDEDEIDTAAYYARVTEMQKRSAWA